jgi:membrane fusion protein, multidrug efflux system
MRKTIVTWLIVVLAITGLSSGLGIYKYNQIKTAEAAAAATPEPMEAVGSVRPRRGEWSATTRAIGTVVALRHLEVRNELAGAIAELGFSSGAVVEAGQLLVQLDIRQEQASLAAAQAEAQLAKQTLERREGLRASAAYSAQEADKARAEFTSASARARGLEVMIDKKRIVAPFRARVGITNRQPGAYLDAGTVISRLQGLDDDAYVDFSLPQDNASTIKPGTTVTLTSATLPGGSATAVIAAEDDSVDGANRTVRFRAVARGHGSVLRPGTFVDVTAVVSQPRDVIMIPLTAVRRSPSGQHVFVLVEQDGKLRAQLRAIRTGSVHNDEVVVETGLAATDVIAAAGSFKLRDGLLVQSAAPPPHDATRLQ